VTTYRFSLVLLGAACLLSLGCTKDEDTGDSEADTDADTDADADADADTDTDTDYMDIYWFAWEAWLGVVDGEFTTVINGGDKTPPTVILSLAEKEWSTNFDDRYVCYLTYTVTNTAGKEDPKAWIDWAVALTPWPEASTCEGQLDPAMFGKDPAATFADWDWEFVITELDKEVRSDLEDQISWWDDVADAAWGGDTYINGESESANWDAIQVNWGYVFELDEDLNVSDDSFVDATDVATGTANGYYAFRNMYIYPIQGM